MKIKKSFRLKENIIDYIEFAALKNGVSQNEIVNELLEVQKNQDLDYSNSLAKIICERLITEFYEDFRKIRFASTGTEKKLMTILDMFGLMAKTLDLDIYEKSKENVSERLNNLRQKSITKQNKRRDMK